MTWTVEDLHKLHDKVSKSRANPNQRVIGFVLHADTIHVDGPNRFTCDWSFIQLYNENIDWKTFTGDKIYIGQCPILSRSSSSADQ